MCLHNGIFQKGSDVVCPVNASGRFTSEVTDFSGQYVKVHTHCIINQDADKGIVKSLKANGRLVHQSTIMHSYPFCWRYIRS